MLTLENLEQILEESLKEEKKAEALCSEILDLAVINGYQEIIEKIRNDEQAHQIIVRELMRMGGGELNLESRD